MLTDRLEVLAAQEVLSACSMQFPCPPTQTGSTVRCSPASAEKLSAKKETPHREAF